MSLLNSIMKLTSGRTVGEDTKMKFSLSPVAETGFSQWLDAMKMVAQLPGGMPSEFRMKLWLQLSEKHLADKGVDWKKAESIIFNEWTNPDDEELGVQIVKDLHRTGCSLFCGEQEQNQALLKRVLLAYARWNKNVGYCQGFNMLAALILQVMNKDEKNAVKVMIYLIEGVLPDSYFANNLRGLSVDMAVFRDLLKIRLPRLSKHLEALQNDTNSGTSYEPPLTNVFTMQWFLTLFSNCLPQQTVLRVWDLVFLYGNEVLLRTALAIWGILQDRVISVESADEFYSIMGVVTREMLEFGLMDANTLVRNIAMVDPFPNELQDLREKYLYNICPWTQSVQSAAKKGIKLFYSDQDDQDDTEDEDKIALTTAYGVFRRRESANRELQVSGPTLDISILKQQYAKLRQRQRQAHVIITAACSSNMPRSLTSGPSVSVNHLLMGKSALVNKGKRIGPPQGSIPPKPNVAPGGSKKAASRGETCRWKDVEKKKAEANGIVGKRRQRARGSEAAEGKTMTNHERPRSEDGEEHDDESSSSSTSTELCDESLSDSEDPGETVEVDSLDSEVAGVIKTTGNRDSVEGADDRGCESIESAAGSETNLRGNVISLSGRTPQHDNMADEVPRGPKFEPEVPIEKRDSEADRTEEEAEASDRDRVRRAGALGLNVIQENSRMLDRFSQKSAALRSLRTVKDHDKACGAEEEERELTKRCWSEGFRWKPEDMRAETETEEKESWRSSAQREALGSLLQVRETSELETSEPRRSVALGDLHPGMVNKEVNTEITFGADEIDLRTSGKEFQASEKPRAQAEEEETLAAENPPRGSKSRNDADDLKTKLEESKSDWMQKMMRIAEVETTVRKTLQADASHRKSYHRSLDRTERRTFWDEDAAGCRSESDRRKLTCPSSSFDAITSRTEKLLGNIVEFERTTPKTVHRSVSSEERGNGEEGNRRDGHRKQLHDSRKPAEFKSPAFNPFPKRTASRSKELATKLGLYAAGPQTKKL